MKTTLDLDSDRLRRLRNREWLTERVGMFAIALTLLAGVFGLLGHGPLSHRIASSSDGVLSVEHFSIERYEGPTELRVSFRRDTPEIGKAEKSPPERRTPTEVEPLEATSQSQTSASETVTICLSRAFTDHVSIERIMPEPLSTRLGDEQLEYSFLISKQQRSGMVVFQFAPMSIGSVKYNVVLANGPGVQISQYVLP